MTMPLIATTTTEALSFMDILKKSFVDQFSGGIDWREMLICISFAFLIGLFVLLVYKLTFKGVVFSDSYALTLVLLTMVTSLIIKTITSNITLSLGMVGALSIVRFRTAVKEASDTAFMFWAIAAGITVGAGFFEVALIGSLIIGLLFYLLTIIRFGKAAPFLLVVRYDATKADVSRAIMKAYKNVKMKTKTKNLNEGEVTFQVKLDPKEQNEILDRVLALDGVYTASLVSYNGDYGA
ncbi:MAG: DUF4956 domain-containing protein [Ruminococcaceae bacterium]|nr:DUF4956 domain-containing protein [Oscillospiraceae bacterium]